jgi:hypothetical protein
MPVILVHQGPTLTEASYEAAVTKLLGGRRRLQTPADWPVDGLLMHAAGQSEAGFRVVDVWESEGAAQRFGESLMPMLKEVGITDVPETYLAHTFVSA